MKVRALEARRAKAASCSSMYREKRRCGSFSADISQLDLSFSEPSGSLPDLLSSSQLNILSVVIETEYESDRDRF